MLAKGGAVLLAVWTAVGLLYMTFLDDGAVGDADRDVARWLEDHRTPTWNSLTHYGSMLSDTLVKVTLVAVVGGAMVIVWRRWHDGVFLAVVVSLEAAVFVITSFIVDRDRPPVAQLDAIPPSGSFPSGHTGAAVAFYGGVFVIVCWHTRNRVVRSVFGFIAVVAPLIVGASRAYRGMHHPIDVAAGLLLGVASILVVRAAIAAGVERDRPHGRRLGARPRAAARPHHTGSRRRRRSRHHPFGSAAMTTTSSTFTDESVSRKVDEVAHRHPELVAVARTGWVAKGVVYGVLGVLAVPIAIEGLQNDRARGGPGEASQLGAVTEIADTSFGTLALWIIAIGLALYVIWRLISILLPAENTLKAWLTRGGYLVSAIVYSLLAWTAVSFATSRSTPRAAGRRAKTPRSSGSRVN